MADRLTQLQDTINQVLNQLYISSECNKLGVPNVESTLL